MNPFPEDNDKQRKGRNAIVYRRYKYVYNALIKLTEMDFKHVLYKICIVGYIQSNFWSSFALWNEIWPEQEREIVHRK